MISLLLSTKADMLKNEKSPLLQCYVGNDYFSTQ